MLGAGWLSPSPSNQWLVFDFQRPVAVSHVALTLWGSALSPRSMWFQPGASPTAFTGGFKLTVRLESL